MASGVSTLDNNQPVTWHSSRVFHKSMLKFHHTTTRYPRVAIKAATQKLESTLQGIIRRLKELKFISRVEYTGSVYEGVKIDTNGELEFDLMVILSGFEKINPHAMRERPGYFTLAASSRKCTNAEQYLEGVEGKERFIMPGKVLSKLAGHITKILQSDPERYVGVSLRPHGPAVQLDVKHAGKDDIWFTVDVVPTIEVKVHQDNHVHQDKQPDKQSDKQPDKQADKQPDKQHDKQLDKQPNKQTDKQRYKVQRFVAKPFQFELTHEAKEHRTGPESIVKSTHTDVGEKWSWRISYSLEEKTMLRTIDRGNECRKQCLRILKAIRDRDPSLHYLHSFVLKNLIIRYKGTMDWEQKYLGRRVVDLLVKLADALYCGCLWHFADKDMNILGNFNRASMGQTSARIKELLRSQPKMLSLINGARE